MPVIIPDAITLQGKNTLSPSDRKTNVGWSGAK